MRAEICSVTFPLLISYAFDNMGNQAFLYFCLRLCFVLSTLRVCEKALLGFEPRISCLLDRRFNQLSHGALVKTLTELKGYVLTCNS